MAFRKAAVIVIAVVVLILCLVGIGCVFYKSKSTCKYQNDIHLLYNYALIVHTYTYQLNSKQGRNRANVVDSTTELSTLASAQGNGKYKICFLFTYIYIYICIVI